MKSEVKKYINTEVTITMTLKEAERLVRLTNKAEDKFKEAKSFYDIKYDPDIPIPIEVLDLKEVFREYYDLIAELKKLIEEAETKEIEVSKDETIRND